MLPSLIPICQAYAWNVRGSGIGVKCKSSRIGLNRVLAGRGRLVLWLDRADLEQELPALYQALRIVVTRQDPDPAPPLPGASEGHEPGLTR